MRGQCFLCYAGLSALVREYQHTEVIYRIPFCPHHVPIGNNYKRLVDSHKLPLVGEVLANRDILLFATLYRRKCLDTVEVRSIKYKNQLCLDTT